MTLQSPGFDGKRRWKCLDEDGEIVGQISGATAEEAISVYISVAAKDPFRRNVHNLVCGGTRLNVQNLVVDQGGTQGDR